MFEEINLPEARRQRLQQFCEALQATLGESLISLTLYGSAARGLYRPKFSDVNLLLVLERVDYGVLERIAPKFAGLRKAINATPYLITRAEWPEVVAAFPTRFLEMKRGYRVLVGHDLLRGIEIDREALEVRCRQELLNGLLRFRHLLLIGTGERAIEDAMRRALPPFIKVLRTLVYLRLGEHIEDRDRLIAAAAEHFEISGEAFAQLMAWRREELHLHGPEWREAAAYFLDGLERVIERLHGD